jgi:LmbE family N-acetylglucosaminyl deacetylase
MQKIILFGLAILLLMQANAQRPIENGADLLQEIKKLNVVTNVLYVAAHPDDENTRLIAWLENEKLARTAYLSLTRGDGGQNLVGTEKGDAMGVLRTQELLEARKIDGAEQFFSRAVDFGYSKTADETLEIWDKQAILADVVYTIRKFRPDVIITRFPPDKRAGHGHHTASALLAEEAFKLAADYKAFPEQFEYVDIWQAKRILWNTSVWWDKQLPEKAAKADDYIKINIGAYNETLGLSYSEIASDSRSQHKSQGFGSARARGNKLEYLKHTDGEKANSDLFEGINTTWSRINGSEKIQEKLNSIIETFDINQPSSSVKSLTELYSLITELNLKPGAGNNLGIFTDEKLESLSQIIKAAAGIHIEFLAEDYNYPANQSIKVKGTAEFIVRTDIPVNIKSVEPILDTNYSTLNLVENEMTKFSFLHEKAINTSNPYWLNKPINKENELSFVDEAIPFWPEQYGMPENVPNTEFNYVLNIAGIDINYNQAIDYKWTDRVDGELHRDVIISPEITATPSETVFIFSKGEAQRVDVLLEGNKDNLSNEIKLIAPEGWKVEPESIPFTLNFKGEQKSISFMLTPPEGSSVGEISFQFNKTKAQAVQRVNYPHVKPQILFPRAKAKVVKMDIKKTVKSIGYVIGSGDEVAANLGQIGFNVVSFPADQLAIMDLSIFETIIVGIRAYNTEESMKNGNSILNEFVKNGGNVIVQYNTNRGLKSDQIGPYPFKLSRNRVTKEEAKPTFLKPKHALLNIPNKLTMADFDGWVQERGLYFADEWDEKYEPIIAWNDPGEKSQEGSILVADYGDGHFIFTGISFFRQLPAGVPGAYRLMTNMISYGK